MDNVVKLIRQVKTSPTAGLKTVGQRVLFLRENVLCVSQEEIAKRISYETKGTGEKRTLSRPAYSMYETNTIPLNIDKLEIIARVFGISPAWLLWGDRYPMELRAPKKVKQG